MGPCMCGDTHCPSCGPAQGNWKCPICDVWADDGCEHIEEETGELKPEFRDLAERIACEQADAEYRAWQEESTVKPVLTAFDMTHARALDLMTFWWDRLNTGHAPLTKKERNDLQNLLIVMQRMLNEPMQWAISALDELGHDLATGDETKLKIAQRAHARANELRNWVFEKEST